MRGVALDKVGILGYPLPGWLTDKIQNIPLSGLNGDVGSDWEWFSGGFVLHGVLILSLFLLLAG